jgi:hypothetical protein
MDNAKKYQPTLGRKNNNPDIIDDKPSMGIQPCMGLQK